MYPNSYVQNIFEKHTYHLNRDALHLGEADSIDDVLDIAERIDAKVYMLAKCCTDEVPTVQVSNFDSSRRLRLTELSKKEREELVDTLEKNGLEYRKTRYLCLTRDYKPTVKCRVQEVFRILYDFKFKKLEDAYQEKFS